MLLREGSLHIRITKLNPWLVMAIDGIGSHDARTECHFPTTKKKGPGPPWFSRDRITGTLAIGYCRNCPLWYNRQYEQNPVNSKSGYCPRVKSQKTDFWVKNRPKNHVF